MFNDNSVDDFTVRVLRQIASDKIIVCLVLMNGCILPRLNASEFRDSEVDRFDLIEFEEYRGYKVRPGEAIDFNLLRVIRLDGETDQPDEHFRDGIFIRGDEPDTLSARSYRVNAIKFDEQGLPK